MNKHHGELFGFQWLVLLLTCLSLCLFAGEVSAAKPSLTVSKASWSVKTKQLLIKGSLKNSPAGTAIEITDINGRQLGMVMSSLFALTIDGSQLPTVPCSVRVQAGSLDRVKPVAGNPNKLCAQVPKCQITAANNVKFANTISVSANTDVNFVAKATFANKKAKPKYEWDFGGGAMGEAIPGSAPIAYKRPYTPITTVQFVRDNSHYRVRFSATDEQKRRCEDTVDVVVGTPPDTGLSKVTEQTAAILGEQLDGTLGKLVVLPYEDWTFQNASDMKLNPNGYSSFNPVVNNLKAVVYSKNKKPPVVQDSVVSLQYSAASNPSDPAGKDSINSTSRNWPLDMSYNDASIKKTDMWETIVRTDNLAPDYVSTNWMQAAWYDYAWSSAPIGIPGLDEGYFKDTTVNPDHGRYMPGINNPYTNNDPQSFSKFNAQTGQFEANMIPLTGIDDTGRVNPYPLLRVEAKDQSSGDVVAKVDAVSTAGSDFHCRECHAKGKIAAKSNEQKVNEGLTPFTKDAYYSTAFIAWYMAATPLTDDQKLVEPPFKDVSDFQGDQNSLSDQEYAAAFNYSSIHDYYDGMSFTSFTLNGVTNPSGQVTADSPHPCYGCHMSQQEFVPFNRDWWDEFDSWNLKSPSYAPNYSIAMHRFHGQLQWNTNKTDIKRDSRGVYERWDWAQGPNNKKSTSLFPIFEDDGVTQLPMEENCNRCHAGHREQFYRDRMYTANVSCYDCHGDMLAVGQAYPKDFANNKDKLNSQTPSDYRVPWFDEPDCGSCHVGNSNVGKDASNGYFSAGVKKRAFDDTGAKADWSATPRSIDANNPDAARFAVVPRFQKSYLTDFMGFGATASDAMVKQKIDTKIDATVFREGRDKHGNVPCAACHGAAHAIWPNRDPSSNDNLTALQLQGHTGTILECNVCHDKDAFKIETDLDGSALYSGDPKPGILGGPHNTHPINDPYWWKDSQDPTDTTTIDSSTYGGWHNNYAKKSGKVGEDQCAACHGNDHKGTRLSRTPVDRVFDFSGFDFAKLKKAGFKSKVIKVAAGTPIGCNTCHSIKTSCTDSPVGTDKCGTQYVTSPIGTGTGTGSQAPVITSQPSIKGLNEGAVYSYQVIATPSNAAFTYSLIGAPAGMTIDTTGLISWTAQKITGNGGKATFQVKVIDASNAETAQSVSVTVCVLPMKWDQMGGGMCM